MNQWHDFLTTQGAIFQEDLLQSFGYAKKELAAVGNTNVLTTLSHFGILEVSGEDAIPFLQGQLTNDVKQLDGSISQYAGYCNPKGRLLALFLAFAHHDHLHLQMPKNILETIIKRLKMYVLRSKVVITDKSNDILCFGVAGQNVEIVLINLFKEIPTAAKQLVTVEDATIIKLIGDLPKFYVYTNMKHAERIWETLSLSCTKVGKPVWDYLEIQAGIPEIIPGTQEAFVPQMINLDALDGINFKKGCYTGQEIVARTHYLGKIKRRTLLAHIATDAIPNAGDSIHLKNLEEQIGQIVRVAPAISGGVDVLVEIRLEHSEASSEIPMWKNSQLQFKPLPYTLN